MSDPQENKAAQNIGVGIGCLCAAIVLFSILQFSYVVSNVFWGWVLLGMASYGIIRELVAKSPHSTRADGIAAGGAMLVWVAGVIWWLKGNAISPEVAGIASFCTIIIVFVVGYALLTQLKGRRRLVLVSSLLCLLAGAFWIYFQISAHSIEIWSIVVLFLAASTLRQGLHNLIGALVLDWKDSFLLYLLPEILTLALLGFLSQFASFKPYFHVIVATLVIALFKLTNERSMQEIEASERSKIGDTSSPAPFRFFNTITQFYSYINMPVLGLLLLVVVYGLVGKLVNTNVESAVFQSSLGTVAIVISFIVLILQQFHQSEKPTSRQTYILRGLTGVAFMFIAIAIVAFLLLTITPQNGANLILPNLDRDSLGKIVGNKDSLLGLVLAALYEWVFLAVPLSLIVIYTLVRDFVTQY